MAGILITGASTGIGEATALHLDGLGHRVFAGVRNEADGERLAAAARSGRLTPVHLDVTDDAGIATALDEVGEASGGRLDGVVNNAGVALGGPLDFLPMEDFRTQMDINVTGLLAVTQAAMPLIRGASGRVVLIGSMSGRLAVPMTGAYSASKFAVEALADTLRMELSPWGLAVSLIQPGAIKTPIWDKGREQLVAMTDRYTPEALESLRRRHRERGEGHRAAGRRRHLTRGGGEGRREGTVLQTPPQPLRRRRRRQGRCRTRPSAPGPGQGRGDRPIPPTVGKGLNDRLTRHRLLERPRCGHRPAAGPHDR
jgi:NAD(P)-dependent dehydrogenase (short-subunit alcohol dehydrogenase family)